MLTHSARASPIEMPDSDSVTDQPSDHTATPGTPGYPPGTEGYPRGENGRAGVDAGSTVGGGDPTDTPEGPRRGDAYWRSLGFSSQREFNEALERDQRRIGEKWRGRRGAPAVPTAPMPGDEIADVPRARRKPLRQVGIKLRPDDYEALARAARLYGARPTTLARLLVNRGVRAVLEAERGAASS